MELEIITSSSKESSLVNWVEITTATGNLVIQAGHIPSLYVLMPGKEVVIEHTNGEQESFLIQEGLAHITRKLVTIIIHR